MYTLSQLKKGIRHPNLIKNELLGLSKLITNPKFLYSKLKLKYVQNIATKYYTHNSYNYNPQGIDIFQQDFDNLILLDACRYDEFMYACDFPGRLEWRVSRGSTSKEFIHGNFKNKVLDDVVYVSANGWYGKLKDRINAEVHEFILAEPDSFDGLQTHPETLTDMAKRVISKYPNKRVIIHYLQPHSPYFGSQGEELFRASTLENIQSNPQILNQDYDRKDQIDAYRQSLSLVLDNVEELLQNISGKTIISSDHGELLGERVFPIPFRKYDHPEGIYVDELTKVPWFVCEHDGRKEIVQEDSGKLDIDKEAIDERLNALGYNY